METKVTYYGGTRDLPWRQMRPNMEATEAYSGVKAEGKVPYYGSKKKPTMEAKEAYYASKANLLWWQKRPTMEAKVAETCDKGHINGIRWLPDHPQILFCLFCSTQGTYYTLPCPPDNRRSL